MPNEVYSSSLIKHRTGSGMPTASAALIAAGATYVWDFPADQAVFAGSRKGSLSGTPNWTFSRASAGYAQTAAGVLVPFASGALRRTDRGVLIEGARTNLCLRSQEFSHGGAWGLNSVTATVGQTDPTNGSTAYLIQESTNGAFIRQASAVTVSSATTYTAYAIAKRGNCDWFRLVAGDSTGFTNAARVWFNLATGAVGSNDAAGTGYGFVAKSIQALGNGWYLCAVTFTAPTTTLFVGLMTASADASTARADVGGGAGVGSNYILWHEQIEAGAFPSSPIVTAGASATRAADSLSVTGLTGLDYPLSLYAEFERGVDTGTTEGWLQLDTNSGDDHRVNLFTEPTDDSFRGFARDTTTTYASGVSGAMAIGTTYKGASRFAANDSRPVRSGTLGTLDNAVTMPNAPTNIRFGRANTNAARECYGYIKRAAIFPSALNDAALQALTS